MPRLIRLLHRVIIFALLSALALDMQGSARFTAKLCRCSFRVPAGWEVVANPKAGLLPLRYSTPQLAPCAFGMRPKGWPRLVVGEDARDFGGYAITIHVTSQRFRDAAKLGFFERVDAIRKEYGVPDAEPHKRPTDWVLHGRQGGLHAANWIRSSGWFGLRGTAAVGYYIEGKGYQGMDDAYRAVLSTGHWRTAIILADNPYTEREFDAVVNSFTFE